MSKRTFMLLLAVWLLATTTFPVKAIETDTANEIEITCQFANAETICDADYRSTECIIRHKEQYLIAQFHEDNAAYNVTGYTSDIDEATLFQFGKSQSELEQLVIIGLADGEYKFETIRTKDDYMVWPFSVSFPSGSVSGFKPIESQCEDVRNGKRIIFTYEYQRGYDLPISEPYTTAEMLLSTIGGGVAISCSIALIAILIHWNTQKKRGCKNG